MGAPKGNQFWKARAKHGRSKIFSSPTQLWNAACEYFQWVDDNPLKKQIIYQGEVTGHEELPRAMTVGALCLFLGVHSQYITDLQKKLDLNARQGKDFNMIINRIMEIIRAQKFEGASAGLFNPNIIARDLGLRDVSERDHKSSDGSMTPARYTPEQYQQAQEAIGLDELD